MSGRSTIVRKLGPKPGSCLEQPSGFLDGSLNKVFPTQQCDYGIECGSPMPVGSLGIGAESFDVEADGEALLRAGKVDQRRADHTVEHGVGMVEGRGAANQAMQELLVVMKGEEERTVPEKKIDVAGEAGGGVVGSEVEIEVEVDAELFELLRVQDPCIAFCGEDRGARGVQGTERMHQGWILLGLGKVVEVVGVLAEVDEVGRWRCRGRCFCT